MTDKNKKNKVISGDDEIVLTTDDGFSASGETSFNGKLKDLREELRNARLNVPNIWQAGSGLKPTISILRMGPRKKRKILLVTQRKDYFMI
jgi:hypothetical protein